MEIIKILGVAFLTSIAALLIKPSKPEIAFAITIAGSILILLLLIGYFKDTFKIIGIIASNTGISNELLKILFKIVGVGYICEFGAGILNDFGSASLAEKVTLAGKIMIMILALPIIENLLKLIQGFIELI